MKAIALINALLFTDPVTGDYADSIIGNFPYKLSSKDADVIDGMINKLAGVESLKYLIRTFATNTDRKVFLENLSPMGGTIISARAYGIYLDLDKTDIVEKAFHEISPDEIDAFGEFMLMIMAKDLSKNTYLNFLTERLSDKSACWLDEDIPENPILDYSKANYIGAQFEILQLPKNNRVCDFALKAILEELVGRDIAWKVFQGPRDIIDNNLSVFIKWWKENGEKVLKGEKVTFPEFISVLVQ